MSELGKRVVRRMRRHRHRASIWSRALWLLRCLPLTPERASLHLTALALGVFAVVASSINSRPAISPTQIVTEASGSGSASDDQAVAQTPEAEPGLSTYVVEAGDTLLKIGERFGVSVATIAAANELDDPDLLEVGQELQIPPTDGILHVLESDETLTEIGRRYGVDPRVIASANRLPEVIDAPVRGQKLVVPEVEPSAAVGIRFFDSKALASKADGAGQQAFNPVAKAAPPSPLGYVVQDGDSLGSLAVQFGVSLRTILLANNIADADSVKVGTRLRVLPVSGIEHEVERGESLADIAAAYRVDLGPIIDFNGLGDPDSLSIGDKLIIPGATGRVIVATAPASSSRSAVAAIAPPVFGGTSAPSRQAAIVAPAAVVGAGGAGVVKNAMAYIGSPYVFGGTSPGGFDCSGFVWYIHKISGSPISRGIWGQLNGGPRITMANLVPGDTVFFANTYMPGLSHVGIYIGGGRFVHAVDESRGVGINNLSDAYWSSRYIGAARLF